MLSVEDRVLTARDIEINYPEIRAKNLRRIIKAIEDLNNSLHWNDLELSVSSETLKHAYYELWTLEELK